jgi:hypothetical protein
LWSVRDGAVEGDVVDEEGERLIERGEHPGHLLGDGREVLAGGALGGQAHGADLQHAARLEHLFLGEPVQRRHELSGPVASVGGPSVMKVPAPCRACTTPIADSACSPARTDGRLTPSERRARARAAGDPRPQFTLFDERPDVRHDVLGGDTVGRSDDVFGG